jgi:CRISPR-associated exonuclease Cas4
MHTFRELATAAYCPRKLYYRRRDGPHDDPPAAVPARREVAFQYERLLSDDDALARAPIAVTPTQLRSRLGQTRARLDETDWTGLVDPDRRDVHLAGRDARGVAHKILASPPRPSLVFTGEPPETGVWEPQTVRLVAAAKALAWERERQVETAFAEYPAYGVIRRVALSTRRVAAYRAALRQAESIDGPPARTDNRAKCAPCEYSDRCGVRTRSLRSML